jgi:hypothetical protein
MSVGFAINKHADRRVVELYNELKMNTTAILLQQNNDKITDNLKNVFGIVLLTSIIIFMWSMVVSDRRAE